MIRPSVCIGIVFWFTATGCDVFQHDRVREPVNAVSGTSKRFFQAADPTGTLKLINTQRSAWEAAGQRIEAIDVEGFNRVVSKLEAVIAKLSAQLESADFAKTTASVKRLADTLDGKLSALEVEQVGSLMSETKKALVQLQETVSGLDGHVHQTLVNANALLSETIATLKGLPVDDLRKGIGDVRGSITPIQEAADRVPETLATLTETIHTMRTTLRVLTGAAVIFALCGLIWIAGVLRKTRHRA